MNSYGNITTKDEEKAEILNALFVLIVGLQVASPLS